MSPSPDDKPIALDAYQALADRYAAKIDTKDYNAYLERPATLALLPDLAGQRVFEAGCGTGWYTRWLLDQGAAVCGVDVSPNMLDHAQAGTGGRADLRLHDLRQPLDFLDDGAFDLVFSSLVMHYLEDWDALFAEFCRILRPGGLFVFSTGHPMADFLQFEDMRYFDVEQQSWPWRGFGGEPVIVPFYSRPLSAISDALWGAGFVIERLVEPLPTEEFRRLNPEDYEKVTRRPAFLCVRARKVTAAPS